jgi:hypothetical protein
MKDKPYCQSLPPWLKTNLGKDCLAPLTSSDARALRAAVHLIDLYAGTCDRSVLEAFAVCVRIMQPASRVLAYHAIAHVMDWGHRAELWAATGFPAPMGKCLYEPGGSVWAAPLLPLPAPAPAVAAENRAAVTLRIAVKESVRGIE